MSRTLEKATADAWVSASLDGFCELSLGRFENALSCWRDAEQVLAGDAPFDPRAAAAKNNEGVACLLLSRRDEAKGLLAEAANLWRLVRDRLGAIDIPAFGRSSSFHFRLAVNHSEAFMNASRRRYEQQCEAALAIARFNTRLAEQRPIECDAYGVIIETLAKGFGSGCPEIGVLKSLSCDPDHALSDNADHGTAAQLLGAYGVKLSRCIAVAQRTPQTLVATDAQMLEVAAQMTALYDPRLVAKRPSGHEQCHG